MIPLDTYFDQFLRERTYLVNVTAKSRECHETAWNLGHPDVSTAIEYLHLLTEELAPAAWRFRLQCVEKRDVSDI